MRVKTLLIVILFVLLNSCATPGPLPGASMAEGDWTQLEQCLPFPDEPDVYSCPKSVLESAYDCMVNCYYDHKDCKAELNHCKKKCALQLTECKGDLSQCKTNHWYWGGGGAAASALLILLLVLL